ncbi:MAG: hypothetical protein KDB15_08630 [Microthrixaceae bacterium]|nr:hypothetical protein [Microthrixaceae bacterium]
MPRTAERIAQAEDGIAQVQTVLEHAQSALEVAGTVEAAARRSRRWLKVLLVLGVLGVVVLIVLKIRGGGEDTHAPADDDAAGSPSRSQT